MKERGTVTHELKTWPKEWDAVLWEMKLAEFRKNDRDFREGDILHLRKWYPETEQYADTIVAAVLHVVYGPAFGIPDGYAMMSINVLGTQP